MELATIALQLVKNVTPWFFFLHHPMSPWSSPLATQHQTPLDTPPAATAAADGAVFAYYVIWQLSLQNVYTTG